jgi:hypothetical protein
LGFSSSSMRHDDSLAEEPLDFHAEWQKTHG